eukprot:GHVU01160102.1.p3 GENE.GHVU01160102.1~~GHVU01160102.1.p3  ORF type:complete len:124 (+),score=19.20 GHVU01160102.1:666-1037(+)
MSETSIAMDDDIDKAAREDVIIRGLMKILIQFEMGFNPQAMSVMEYTTRAANAFASFAGYVKYYFEYSLENWFIDPSEAPSEDLSEDSLKNPYVFRQHGKAMKVGKWWVGRRASGWVNGWKTG